MKEIKTPDNADWKHRLCSANKTTTAQTKQDGREQLRAGAPRSLAWLLILSCRTETMRRLGINLCWVFQFGTPPTGCPPRHRPLVSWWSTEWLVMRMKPVFAAPCTSLLTVDFIGIDLSKHWLTRRLACTWALRQNFKYVNNVEEWMIFLKTLIHHESVQTKYHLKHDEIFLWG